MFHIRFADGRFRGVSVNGRRQDGSELIVLSLLNRERKKYMLQGATWSEKRPARTEWKH